MDLLFIASCIILDSDAVYSIMLQSVCCMIVVTITKPVLIFICRYGSITQASTVRLGTGINGQDVYIPMSQFLPMVDPNDIVVDGWDISSANLADAMKRAQVLDVNLQHQLYPYMKDMKPRPSIYFPEFIAANQV